MKDKENISDCQQFKELFEQSESGRELSCGEQAELAAHEKDCRGCLRWQQQHREIAALSAGLPQFDVSEGLTRKIMNSVEKQYTPGVQTSLLPLGLAAGIGFVVMVPFDSVQSIFGWGVGIVGLMALQFLMKTANRQEQLT